MRNSDVQDGGGIVVPSNGGRSDYKQDPSVDGEPRRDKDGERE